VVVRVDHIMTSNNKVRSEGEPLTLKMPNRPLTLKEFGRIAKVAEVAAVEEDGEVPAFVVVAGGVQAAYVHAGTWDARYYETDEDDDWHKALDVLGAVNDRRGGDR